MEKWLPVKGFEGFYEVSDLGRVRSLPRMSRVNSISKGKRLMGGKIRLGSPDRGGYMRLQLTALGKVTHAAVHTLVLEAFIGPKQKGQVARHLDGNPSNNTLQNLCWGTHLENMQDRKQHGRYSVGEDHVSSKLTNEQARYIYDSELSGSELASMFNVGNSTISRIKKGKVFANATGGQPRETVFRNQYTTWTAA